LFNFFFFYKYIRCGELPRNQLKNKKNNKNKNKNNNHLGGGPVVKAWDQEICSLCGLRFEPCGCSYDGY